MERMTRKLRRRLWQWLYRLSSERLYPDTARVRRLIIQGSGKPMYDVSGKWLVSQDHLFGGEGEGGTIIINLNGAIKA